MKKMKLGIRSVWVLGVLLSNLTWAGLRDGVTLDTAKSDLESMLYPRNGYVVRDVLGLIESYLDATYRPIQDDVLKESVIDPRSVIWGGVVKNNSGLDFIMNHAKAYDYCLNLNPPETRDQVNQALMQIEADEGMKSAFRAHCFNSRSTADAIIQKYQELFNKNQDKLKGAYFLPSAAHFLQFSIDRGHDFTINDRNSYRLNLSKTLPDLGNRWYWSSSVHSDFKDGAYYFNANYGHVNHYNREYDGSVRCIRPLSAWE